MVERGTGSPGSYAPVVGPLPGADPLGEVGGEILGRDPLLRGRVAVADRDRAVLHALRVDRDAEGGPDLVAARVALADRRALVVDAAERVAQALVDRAAHLGHPVLLDEGVHAHLRRRELRVEVEHDAGLPVRLDLLLEGVGDARRGSSGRRRRPARPRRGRPTAWWPRRGRRAPCRSRPGGPSGRSRRATPRPRPPSSRRGRGTRCRSRPSRSGRAPPSRGRAGAAATRGRRGPSTTGGGSPSSASNHSPSVPGTQKNSHSICSNSRMRKSWLRTTISLRNDLPCCAIPKGTFTRVVSSTFLKFTNMPCAVSGRR